MENDRKYNFAKILCECVSEINDPFISAEILANATLMFIHERFENDEHGKKLVFAGVIKCFFDYIYEKKIEVPGLTIQGYHDGGIVH